MNPLSNPTATLRDIKPPVAIDDWSLFLYWSIVFLLGGLMLLLAYAIWRIWRAQRRTDRRREALEALKQIDWSHPKKAAYSATTYGRLLAPISERTEELYGQMVSALAPYKYKPVVDPIDTEARAQCDLFIRVCDESL
jgi:hypothetical protein